MITLLLLEDDFSLVDGLVYSLRMIIPWRLPVPFKNALELDLTC